RPVLHAVRCPDAAGRLVPRLPQLRQHQRLLVADRGGSPSYTPARDDVRAGPRAGSGASGTRSPEIVGRHGAASSADPPWPMSASWGSVRFVLVAPGTSNAGRAGPRGTRCDDCCFGPWWSPL